MIVSPPQILLDATSPQLQQLTLESATTSTLIYKVRTTNPKRFIVKPAMGYLSPQKEQVVKILIQDKEHFVKERFQIIYQPVSSRQECGVHWKQVDQAKNQQVQVDVINQDTYRPGDANESKMFQTVVNQPINSQYEASQRHPSETNSLFHSKYLEDGPEITVNRFQGGAGVETALKDINDRLDILSRDTRELKEKLSRNGTSQESTLPLIYLLIGIIIINFMAIIFKR